MSAHSILPALVRRGGRTGRRARIAIAVDARTPAHAPPPASWPPRGRRPSDSGPRRARDGEAAKAEVAGAPRWRRSSSARTLDRDVARRREEWERLERRIEDRGRAHERKLEEAETPRARASGEREETLAQRELALRAREGEADRLAPGAARQARAHRRPHRRGGPARDPAARRGRGPRPGRGAGPGHQGAGASAAPTARPAASSPWRSQRIAAEHTAETHRGGGGAAQRRDEGPDHRPRGAEHPRLRDRHRCRRHHRRHARHGRDLLLRSDPPRGGAPLARGADRRMVGSIRAASRSWSPSRRRSWRRSWSSSASRPRSRPASTGSIRSSSS